MISLLAALAFLCLNIVFVMVEYALVRIPASRVELLVRQGERRALLIQNMLRNLDNYLSAVQLGITIASLGLGWLGQPGLARFLHAVLGSLIPGAALETLAHGMSLAVAFAALTFFQIVLGELIPRTIAIQKVDAVALFFAWPFEVFYRVFRMPINLMARTSKGILRLLGFRPAAEHEQAFSEEEIRILLGTSQEKGILPLDRLLVMENLFDFSSLRGKDAMVPRERIVYLSRAKSWEENMQTIRSKRFSRYPLCETDLTQVLGIVHLKDVVLAGGPSSPDLVKIKRETSVFIETEPLPSLFKMMMGKGKHMVLLRDSAGKITGLITLEDILEELVGEIHDEFDLPGAWSLNTLLTAEHLELDLKTDSAKEVIRSLLRRLGGVIDLDATHAAVWERETGFPTGIGKGIAVPHARLPGLDRSYVLIGRGARPLGFVNPDGVPVRLVFLLLTPAAAPMEQIRLLSRIALLGSSESLRRRLMKAKTPEQFLEILRTSETLLAG
jgi:CBS domain containing-hemolysin-like protein